MCLSLLFHLLECSFHFTNVLVNSNDLRVTKTSEQLRFRRKARVPFFVLQTSTNTKGNERNQLKTLFFTLFHLLNAIVCRTLFQLNGFLTPKTLICVSLCPEDFDFTLVFLLQLRSWPKVFDRRTQSKIKSQGQK